VISPDATETPGINALAGLPNLGPDAARHATAEEVASAALFLASGLSSLTTDADIPVNDGINQ
jgi:NAD(P)-dependent dehydrogenase (short-subunit alcohol dehydrogenase family)